MNSVLVVNVGSSSIKYQVLEVGATEPLVAGVIERIGTERANLRHVHGEDVVEQATSIPDHEAGLRAVLAAFDDHGPSLADVGLVGVGHRVVHGGQGIDGPRLVDDALIAEIERLAPLAPLLNPPALQGVRIARELLPEVPHVAVFDTAFFHDLPPAAATYAIDADLARVHQIRRYGFHGTSHRYVAGAAAMVLGRPLADLNQIVLHLGNGASAAAISGGRAVETSMGLTPLEGLVMGTRSGDLDPAILLHLTRVAGTSVDELDELLNRRSGLLGLTGHSDIREVIELAEQGDAGASLAMDVYAHRLRKYIGAYHAVLGRLDALVFTAGVGENNPAVRASAVAGLAPMGIEIDPARNEASAAGARVVSPDGARVTVLVVPTHEELAIARQVVDLTRSSRPRA